MIILTIETGTSQQSVALLDKGKVLGSFHCRPDQSLTNQLLPGIDRLLGDVGVPVQNLEGLAVAIGPGSFTSLRVGLSTMAGLRVALGIPLVGVSTLEGLAWNLPMTPLPILSTVYIKPGSLYWGTFAWEGERIIPLGEEQMGTVSEAIQDINGRTMVIGDGWKKNQELFLSENGRLVPPQDGPRDPSARGIGLAGRILLEKGLYLQEGMSPRYLQLSYAEAQANRERRREDS